MQIFKDIDDVKYTKNTVITLGTFDGLHLGHQKILKEVIDRANIIDGRNFVVTFHPHPRKVVSNFNIKLLTTLDEKISLLDSYNIENLLIINFTKEFSQISSEKFIVDYLFHKIGMDEIIIGHDHQFGKNRSGNKETLNILGKENGFKVDIIGPVSSKNEIISSTSIRNNLIKGNLNKVTEFLGRNYSFRGKIVEGDKRGRTLGFPTININVDEDKLLPQFGIYAVRILLKGKMLNGVMSIGIRPTFYKDGKVTAEVFIFDFDEDVYGENAEIFLIEKLRNEIKFESANALIDQMHLDTKKAKDILKNINN